MTIAELWVLTSRLFIPNRDTAPNFAHPRASDTADLQAHTCG